MIEIELNGERRTLDERRTVQDLVAELDLAGKACAVAINREVVPRQQWPQRHLQAADRVDIVRAIGGG
ncbi:sulfur carrier protein ThiS [Lacisediminimonas profundi]|uniref:sulfur carrier protein ThiS n=1 Tax=Lacisediminimonas profundi TaxID=2603856 RepID=UPI00124B0AB6|nr:sulfur carrier protein ThiS [Lacisediminimonas profundi]